MLTDILIDRLPEGALRAEWTEYDRRLMVQATKILERLFLSEPDWPQPGGANYEAQHRLETTYRIIHDRLCEELGIDHLVNPTYWYDAKLQPKSYASICVEFLTTEFEAAFETFHFIGERLSLIELGFRQHYDFLRSQNDSLAERVAKIDAVDPATASPIALLRLGPDGKYLEKQNAVLNKHYQDAVAEFNTRLRRAGYKLHYHNGYIQLSDDELTTDLIQEPFWKLVAAEKWASVDQQMKEAIDAKDRGDRTATLHAFSALESVVKIISDAKQWTRGTEKGASHYVDNLVSKKNGGIIDDWEADMLKGMFGGVRNPFAHGPGAGPLPAFTHEQTVWAVDTAMAWAKSLITRM